MKTPEEIKKGLECCMDYQSCAEYGESKCPYNDVTKCMEALLADALAYIQQLEMDNDRLDKAVTEATELLRSGVELVSKRNKELEAQLAQVEREKYAAISELANSCYACRFILDDSHCEGCFQRNGKYPWSPMARTKFEWRGVYPENTKEDAKE